MREKHPLTGHAASIDASAERESFADDVGYYLSLQPRQLPSRYFYDALGSALVRGDLPVAVVSHHES